MAQFMTPKMAQLAIEAQGTQFFTIVFAKKDGEIARKNVRARMTSRRVQKDAPAESLERAARQAETLAKHNMIFLDYPQGGRGCSVRMDRIIAVEGQGATIQARA